MSTDEQTLSTEPGITTVVTTENVTITESAVEQPKEEMKTEEQKSSEQQKNYEKKLTGFQLHPENINKGGRPKREWTWAGLLEEYADQIHAKSGKTFKEIIGKRLLHDSANGNIHATRELMNRMDGMPKQSTELSGPNGGPIPILQGVTNSVVSTDDGHK